jgi:hypothetical protein
VDARKVNFWRLLVLAALFNTLIQAIHEDGHWAVYQAMGRGPVWGFTSLVQLWNETPLHPSEWIPVTTPDGEQGWLHLNSSPASTAEEVIMLAAGPLATLLTVIAGLSLRRFGKSPVAQQMGLLLALVGSLMAGPYYWRAPFRGNSGDEYFMAADLGVPKSVIDIPLGLAFLLCFILSLRALGEWRTMVKWTGAVLLGSFLTGISLMQANEIVQAQVNQGNSWFQPVWGFSLPVLIVNGLAFISLAIWWYRAGRSPSL